jgi:Protein of unknown function (DUF2997)
MKAIEILINASGQLTINATGFSGTDCEKATAFLEQALGQLTAKQRKPEWRQQNRRANQQRVGV